VAFRKAQLAAKRNLAQAQRQERALLLASYATPLTRSGATSPSLDGGNTSGSGSAHPQQQQPQQPPSTGYVPPHKRRHRKQQDGNDTDGGRDGAVVSAASDVTAALRRTHDLMAGELARSDFARQTLAESSAALAQLGESYGSLDTLLAGSRDLLGALLRSQKSDTWYLETALYLLAGTLGWLVFRRWLYGPLWWLVWLPLRTIVGLGFRAGKGAVGFARGPEAARMEVVGGGVDGGREGARVVGMADDGSVPTAKVGGEAHQGRAERNGDPDSMVEKVGKIVDGDQAEEDQPRNPKKRMWEGDRDVAQEAQRARDEL
jgi:protein transport protein SEC20